MSKTIIHTEHAPAAIGAYSQAVRAGNTVYLSGQIPLDPTTMQCVEGVLLNKPTKCSKTCKRYVKPLGDR